MEEAEEERAGCGGGEERSKAVVVVVAEEVGEVGRVGGRWGPGVNTPAAPIVGSRGGGAGVAPPPIMAAKPPGDRGPPAGVEGVL